MQGCILSTTDTFSFKTFISVILKYIKKKSKIDSKCQNQDASFLTNLN